MNADYAKIEKAIQFIRGNLQSQPSLEEVADAVGLSSFHLQRLFREWAGISPKRFLQFLTVVHAKQLLSSLNVLDTTIELGLSSQSRLHDHFVTLEAVTPGEFKSAGENVKINFGIAACHFGRAFIAATGRGVCQISFLDENQPGEPLQSLKQAWPNAAIVENRALIAPLSDSIFNSDANSPRKFHLQVQGSNFQVKVWQALLKIPSGTVRSYQQIAKAIDRPSASRAVANAIGKNPIGYLIPCHRVIKSTGLLGGYQWGMERKQAILSWEAAQMDLRNPG